MWTRYMVAPGTLHWVAFFVLYLPAALIARKSYNICKKDIVNYAESGGHHHDTYMLLVLTACMGSSAHTRKYSGVVSVNRYLDI